MTETIPAGVDADRIAHIEPVGDLREHDTGARGDCWCRPTVESHGAGWVVIHNAMDGREAFETGERKPS